MDAIRLVHVEDLTHMTDALRDQFALHAPEIQIVGVARKGRDAVKLILDQRPDVCLVDLMLPDTGALLPDEIHGIGVIREVLKAWHDAKLLVHTSESHHLTPYVLQNVLAEGAYGVLFKKSSMVELIEAIRSVANGRIYLDPAVAAQLYSNQWQNMECPVADYAAPEKMWRVSSLRLLERGHSSCP